MKVAKKDVKETCRFKEGFGYTRHLPHTFASLIAIISVTYGFAVVKIFVSVKRKIQTWPVLVNFLIHVETIKMGGGSTVALEILTEYSEKQKDVETNKKSLLRPYVILAFIWSVLIALTTSMVV